MSKSEREAELEDRVDELEDTVKKMLPSRRDVLLGGAVAGAAGLSGFGAGTASADGHNDGDTQWGTETNRDDYLVDHLDANSIGADDLEISGDAVTVVPSDDLDTALDDAGQDATVLVRSGTYDLPDAYENPTGQRIIGLGDVTILPRSEGTEQRMWDISADTTVERVTIDLNGSVSNGPQPRGDRSVVRHCKFTGGGTDTYALNVYGADDVVIENNWFWNNDHYGCAVTGENIGGSPEDWCENATVTDNHFWDCGYSALKLRGIRESVIKGNTVRLTKGQGYHGIRLHRNDEATTNNEIIGNTVIDTDGTSQTVGFMVDSGDPANSGKESFADNTAVNCYRGFRVQGPGVTVENNTTVGSRWAGIRCNTDATGVRLIANDVADGIACYADDAVIQGNTVTGGVAGYSDGGITILNGPTAQIIRDNVIDGPSGDGILVNEATDTLVRANDIKEPGGTPINDFGTGTETVGNYHYDGSAWTAL